MAKKILVVHCSPRKDGNSSMLADRFIEGAEAAGNTVQRIDIGHDEIRGCRACEYCFTHDGECVQQDHMQKYYRYLREYDVLVWATPMYFYSFPGQLRCFQDRMFCQIGKPFTIKSTALLLCFEDEDQNRAKPTIESYRVCADYCKLENLGEVVVNGVYEKGAIEGNPGLQSAYDLGKGIS